MSVDNTIKNIIDNNHNSENLLEYGIGHVGILKYDSEIWLKNEGGKTNVFEILLIHSAKWRGICGHYLVEKVNKRKTMIYI